LKWLCTHPPGGKCVNCIKVSKKDPSGKCSHSPTVRCPNCLPEEVKKQATKAKCLHGVNAACENCLPKDENESTKMRFCRNHGTHGSCLECIEREASHKPRIKRQEEAHCVGVQVQFHAANVFQNFMQRNKFAVQRVGICYGHFTEDGTSVVEVIYEPKQQGSKDTVVMHLDPVTDQVDAIANMLGLQKVGWIFSHAARKQILTATEIVQAAQLQNACGAQFVTLTLSLNEQGLSNLEAFQVSDQCLKLEKEGKLSASENPNICTVQDGAVVEGAETTNVDCHFFLINVPVASKKEPFFGVEFPIENREPAQSEADIKVHFMNQAKKPFIKALSDFHLLVYLAISGFFDINSDIPALCEAVRTQNERATEGFKILINSQFQLGLK